MRLHWMDKKKPSYYGHRKRVKQKFKETGISGWHDYEILELALTYAIPHRDTKPLAKKLIEQFKTLDTIFNADINDLIAMKGISEHTALFLRLIRDIALKMLEKKMYTINVVAAPEDGYNYLKLLLEHKPDEEFVALFLNNKNCVIAHETIQRGTVDETIVYPRKIAERALYHHATGVIIAHNHPAGSLIPSENDMKVTKSIKYALRTVDVALHDHILIGKNGYYSWKDKRQL